MSRRGKVVRVVVLLLVFAFAMPAAAYSGSFADDDGSVHEADIEAVAAQGITRGCNPPDNDRFCPDEPVTRGQMAAFLRRALNLEAGAGANLFLDDDELVFEGDIDRLATAGITLGCNPPSNDRFCPIDVVTRGQMAAFLVRAFGYPAGSAGRFVDTGTSVFERDIEALAGAEITLGCNPPDNDRFCPDDPVSRAQMATFLTRALGLDPVRPEPTDPAWYTTPEPAGLGKRVVTVSPGGSPTLAEALADVRPGDVIELAAGTHVNTTGNLVVRGPGTETEWIAIRGAEGSRPVIDLDGRGEFRVSSSYVLLENLELVDGSGNNLHIAPEATTISNIVVRGVHIHDLRDGPGAAIKVNRNNDEATGVSRVYIEEVDVSESLANAVIDGVGASYAVVRDSHIHDNEPGSHGVFFKGGSDHVLIEGNLIRGITQNAALQLGGNTGFGFFNPSWPDWEGIDQTARNNLITDFTDSAIEIRGVYEGRVYHNTIVTQTSFAIFRLSCGNTDMAGLSSNTDIDISNNLVIGTGGDPQYARNDCGGENIRFGPQGWFGPFHDSGSPTPLVPSFPQSFDVSAPNIEGVVTDPSYAGLGSVADAVSRFTPTDESAARAAGEPLDDSVPLDIEGVPRSSATPTLGAIED